ncbi:MAG: hypothetical protein SFV55_04620 [Haliscomenobacter sp.]|uniref:hypothetical protein n=1 Tax=Haliscomenobacter sp. TaxID=2717303 RepID=UPI0029B9A17C|nr:hypothetical protein [Haliscomenobacter sp.]MDX2067685.1 hypothetical protein [Haliscomenobacter sp.]
MFGKILVPSLCILFFGLKAFAQSPVKAKPVYCDNLPSAYDAKPKPKALPVFNTKPGLEYRVQVAVLKDTDPRNYHFHNSLAARYQPCEQVWIVESKKTFKSRAEAERLKAELERLGYPGSYITTIVSYE